MTPDPRRTAQRWFASVEGANTGMDIVTRYATDPPLALQTLLDAIAGDGLPPQRICELGFGTGWLLEAMSERLAASQICGLDLSAAMAREACTNHPRTRIVIGDMEALPFRRAAFDVIATCWTLYFMRDIDLALEQIKDALRPAGRLVAATVASDHMHELDEMVGEAMHSALGSARESDIAGRFDLDTATPYLLRQFEHVELREWRGEMRLPDADLFVTFWAGFGEARSLGPGQRERVARELRSIAKRRITRDGDVRITRHDGAFVAWDDA
jgi:SAM-dependent methyltransferase